MCCHLVAEWRIDMKSPIIRDFSTHLMCDDRLIKAAGEILKKDYQMIYLNSWEFKFNHEKLKRRPVKIEDCIVECTYNELLKKYHNISYDILSIDSKNVSDFFEYSDDRIIGFVVDSKVYKNLLKIDNSIRMVHDFYPFLLIHYEKNTGTIYLYDVHLLVNVIETDISKVFGNDDNKIKLFVFRKNEDYFPLKITIDILYSKYLENNYREESDQSYNGLLSALKNFYNNKYETKKELIKRLKEAARQKYLFTIALNYIYENTQNDLLKNFIYKFYLFSDKWNVLYSSIYKYYVKKETLNFDKISIYIKELNDFNNELIEDLAKIKCGQEVIIRPATKKHIEFTNKYNVVFDKYKNDNYSQDSIESCEKLVKSDEAKIKFLDHDITKTEKFGFYDNMICKNQKIPVTYFHKITHICIYGFSDNGSFTDYIDIIYTDSTSEHIEIALSDKNGFPCFGEDIAWTAPIVQIKEGVVQKLKNHANVYRSVVSLKQQKIINYISFCNMPNMHIIKIELCI